MNDQNVHWRKSSYSGSQGDCVETARVPDGIVVRDSKDANGPVLRFTADEWWSFVAAVKAGKPQ
jgi:Domain of unknown function (DUF397)